MKHRGIIIENIACSYLKEPDDGYSDVSEMIMFCREAVESGFPEYVRWTKIDRPIQAQFLLFIKTVCTLACNGKRDQKIEDKIITQYLSHHNCLVRMSLFPFGNENSLGKVSVQTNQEISQPVESDFLPKSASAPSTER